MVESFARQDDENMWDELDDFHTRQDLSANNTFAEADLESTHAILIAAYLEPNQCPMAVNSLILADIMHPSSGAASYFVRADAVTGGGQELKQVLLASSMTWMCFIQTQLALQQIMISLLGLFMFQVLVPLQLNKM